VETRHAVRVLTQARTAEPSRDRVRWKWMLFVTVKSKVNPIMGELGIPAGS
jgi:hypothetical protein